jgi:hypothetical protein
LLPAFFETPLEEFELQSMDAEEMLSADSMEWPEQQPCSVTVRHHGTCEEQVELKGTVAVCSQTDEYVT